MIPSHIEESIPEIAGHLPLVFGRLESRSGRPELGDAMLNLVREEASDRGLNLLAEQAADVPSSPLAGNILY